MNKHWLRLLSLSVISFLMTLVLTTWSTPSYAHWADLAVAEVLVDRTEAQMTLTFPTGLMAFADDNRDNQLSPDEVRTHKTELQNFLRERIRLTDGDNHNGSLSVEPADTVNLPSNLNVTVGTHSILVLVYTWPDLIRGLKIHYDLFLPGVPTARCLATISKSGQVQNFIFGPENRQLSLMPGLVWSQAGTMLVAVLGSLVWGAMHAMSPGHGKTVVGAYLVGSHATAKHAVFLGLTTTIAHTAGVFALGLVTLFASQYILPQLYPWLSFLSGLMVVVIGLNLFMRRVGGFWAFKQLSFGHSHDHHHHDRDRHSHHHHDHHHDGHSHGNHSHLPSSADAPVTWRSLLALGISGGLVPCPSALVLLLSAIAMGRIGFGLVLVLAFSLGLAGVLTALGLLLVYAKRLFQKLPTKVRLVKILPAVSALVVTLIGLGISTQALMQTGLVTKFG